MGKLHSRKFVEELLEAIKRKKNTTKYIRFSESGDFSGQHDVEKMSKIAEMLKDHNVGVYTYTTRKDLNFQDISDNLVVNGSGFMISNNFYIVDKKEDAIDKYICPSSCINCSFCKKIYWNEHSSSKALKNRDFRSRSLDLSSVVGRDIIIK